MDENAMDPLEEEQDLRDLRRFARAGRRLHNQPRLCAQRTYDLGFELEDRKVATIRRLHIRRR